MKKYFRVFTALCLTGAVVTGLFLTYPNKYRDVLLMSALETKTFRSVVYKVYGEHYIDNIVDKYNEDYEDTVESIEVKSVVDSSVSINNSVANAKELYNEDNELYNKYNIPSYLRDKIKLEKPKYSQEIEIQELDGGKYKGWVMIVHDPSRVSVVTTSKLGKEGEKLMDMYKREGAIAAFNGGGFYDYKGVGNGGQPTGIVIEDGNIVYINEKYNNYEIIGLTEDNKLIAGVYTLDEIKNLKVRDAVSFKPVIIKDGKPIKELNFGYGLNPRTVIGQREDGAIVVLVVDGRSIKSIGINLRQAQDIMLKYGCVIAANLDGGASTELIYEDKTINNPCGSRGARRIATGFVVK